MMGGKDFSHLSLQNRSREGLYSMDGVHFFDDLDSLAKHHGRKGFRYAREYREKQQAVEETASYVVRETFTSLNLTLSAPTMRRLQDVKKSMMKKQGELDMRKDATFQKLSDIIGGDVPPQTLHHFMMHMKKHVDVHVDSFGEDFAVYMIVTFIRLSNVFGGRVNDRYMESFSLHFSPTLGNLHKIANELTTSCHISHVIMDLYPLKVELLRGKDGVPTIDLSGCNLGCADLIILSRLLRCNLGLKVFLLEIYDPVLPKISASGIGPQWQQPLSVWWASKVRFQTFTE
jgi:hypothetical protein